MPFPAFAAPSSQIYVDILEVEKAWKRGLDGKACKQKLEAERGLEQKGVNLARITATHVSISVSIFLSISNSSFLFPVSIPLPFHIFP